jgi:antiviral helicase SKI2
MREEIYLKLSMLNDHFSVKGLFLAHMSFRLFSSICRSYKDAGESLRRKQDKEREAAGLPPVQRVGARGNQRESPAGRGGPNARSGPNARGGQNAQGAQRGSAPVRGGGPPRTMHMASDKNLYVHLLGTLRKKELLPVVVFTFSKKRCEEYAATLRNSDLCTSVAKSEIHVTIEKALARLNGESISFASFDRSGDLCVGSDRKLPQIGRMRDLLSRGIGVHHGGLLPIVKEVCRGASSSFPTQSFHR